MVWRLRWSLPVRGAWIEILSNLPVRTINMSLPVRGAWIEIKGIFSCQGALESLPVRGAWIEIRNHAENAEHSDGRSL